MAQNKISLNLSAADFTLSYRFKGPSVIIPGQDQNAFAAQAWFSGDTKQRGVNIPQMAYCENTVPTQEGYRSVAYKYFIEPPETVERFTKILTIFDGNGSSCLVGVTADRKLFIVSAYTDGKWRPLPLPTGTIWHAYLGVTNTAIFGNALLCIRGLGVFKINVPDSSISKQTITGLDDTLASGICASKGYLIAYDDTRIYWSSTEDPFDFTPSLITGAGSGIPEGLKGKIVLAKEIDQGFIVYADACILSCSYSSNKGIPWIFSVLSGGAGIRHEDAVAYDINMSQHYAWTASGFIGIELHKANPILPQVTDFIASGLSDKTVGFSTSPSTVFDPRNKEVRTSIVSSRYVFISFGYLSDVIDNEARIPRLEQSFVWDTQLKRWGKLNAKHIQIFETPFAAAPPVFF